jgi:hypothetical protein
MGGRWNQTCEKLHIFYKKRNDDHELDVDFLRIRESYQS